MNNDLKAFSTDELFHLTQTIITTVKLLRPEATTNDIMDTAVVAISAMAAGIYLSLIHISEPTRPY